MRRKFLNEVSEEIFKRLYEGLLLTSSSLGPVTNPAPPVTPPIYKVTPPIY
jgi:hypothetical protein